MRKTEQRRLRRAAPSMIANGARVRVARLFDSDYPVGSDVTDVAADLPSFDWLVGKGYLVLDGGPSPSVEPAVAEPAPPALVEPPAPEVALAPLPEPQPDDDSAAPAALEAAAVEPLDPMPDPEAPPAPPVDATLAVAREALFGRLRAVSATAANAQLVAALRPLVEIPPGITRAGLFELRARLLAEFDAEPVA